jgi:FkbM family methyltransferase
VGSQAIAPNPAGRTHSLLARARRARVVEVATGLARLAPSRAKAIRMILRIAWLWVQFRRSSAPRGLTPIEVIAYGTRWRFRVRDFVDLCVAEEVFADEVYELDDPGDPAIILDLGSHIGLSALWFRARFPQARILCFEPDPANFALLVDNVGDVPGIEAHNAAVGSSERIASFYSAEQSWLSSLLPSEAGRSAVATPVKVLAIRKIVDALEVERVDLLKLDIEGAEWEILDATPLDSLAELVVGELHRHGCPHPTPVAGLPRLGAFELEVRQNDADCCVFAGRRVRSGVA